MENPPLCPLNPRAFFCRKWQDESFRAFPNTEEKKSLRRNLIIFAVSERQLATGKHMYPRDKRSTFHLTYTLESVVKYDNWDILKMLMGALLLFPFE